MNRRGFLGTSIGAGLMLAPSIDGASAAQDDNRKPSQGADRMEAPGQTDITLANWRQQPYNRRAFHALPAEIAQAPIAGGGAQRVVARSGKSVDAFALRLPDGATLRLDQFLSVSATDAMIVLHEGRVVYEIYKNGMQPQSRHIAMSATKAVVGLLAEILAFSGAVDPEAPVTSYIPEIKRSPYAGATLRHLLDMRTGVRFDQATETSYAQATGWDPASGEKTGLAAFFSGLLGSPAEHGGPFHYHSANTDLLGWAIERATGRKIQDLVSEKLWRHIASDNAAMTLDWSGLARSAGGLCATVRDLAWLGLAVAADGQGVNGQAFPRHIVDGLVANGDRPAWATGQWAEPFAPIGRKMSYRSGWYTIDDSPELLFAMGIHGQNIFIDRRNAMVVAKVSSWQQPVDGRALWLTHAAVNEMRRCILA